MLLARTADAGATAWYLSDRLGTVRDLADPAGTVIDHIAYDSFGRVTSETNPSAGDRFKFTGRELDAGTGLQYHRARYYDAALGRWTQEDPIGFGGGDANLYRYVGNGPTGKVDPSGLADFHLGGQGYVWPWNPSAGGMGQTVGSYGRSLGVIGAGGLGGMTGGAISGGATAGAAGTLAGLVMAGPAGVLPGLGMGLQVGGTSGGIAGGMGGAWGALTSPAGTTMGDALNGGFDAGLGLGLFAPLSMSNKPGGYRPWRMPSRQTCPAPNAGSPKTNSGISPADFANEAAAILENAARSRGRTPNPNIVAAKAPKLVDVYKLIPPESRPFADPQKLLDHGPFDWEKYEPIWVETDGRGLWLMNGMTRVENAKRAGITRLPAYIFPR